MRTQPAISEALGNPTALLRPLTRAVHTKKHSTHEKKGHAVKEFLAKLACKERVNAHAASGLLCVGMSGAMLGVALPVHLAVRCISCGQR